MEQRLRKHGEFTAEEEKELFRTPPLTARKQRASTQSEPEPETPTKRPTGGRFNSDESLLNTPTGPLNTMTMDSFEQEQGESLRTEQPQEEESRPQEGSRSMSHSSNMTPQQQFEFQMME